MVKGRGKSSHACAVYYVRGARVPRPPLLGVFVAHRRRACTRSATETKRTVKTTNPWFPPTMNQTRTYIGAISVDATAVATGVRPATSNGHRRSRRMELFSTARMRAYDVCVCVVPSVRGALASRSVAQRVCSLETYNILRSCVQDVRNTHVASYREACVRRRI